MFGVRLPEPKGLSLKTFCKATKNNKKFVKVTDKIDSELPSMNALTAIGLITNIHQYC